MLLVTFCFYSLPQHVALLDDSHVDFALSLWFTCLKFERRCPPAALDVVWGGAVLIESN